MYWHVDRTHFSEEIGYDGEPVVAGHILGHFVGGLSTDETPMPSLGGYMMPKGIWTGPWTARKSVRLSVLDRLRGRTLGQKMFEVRDQVRNAVVRRFYEAARQQDESAALLGGSPAVDMRAR